MLILRDRFFRATPLVMVKVMTGCLFLKSPKDEMRPTVIRGKKQGRKSMGLAGLE